MERVLSDTAVDIEVVVEDSGEKGKELQRKKKKKERHF